MKLHTIVLSLTLSAAAAHADLFDRLKEIEKDVSEIKEAIEEIGGGEDEAGSDTADTTKGPENTAFEVEQDTAANVPAEDKSSSKSRNSDSSAGQSLYGWLDRVSYSQGRSPMIDGLGLKNPGTYINLSVVGVTRMFAGELQCNALYLDSSLPQIDGISVSDLSGKSAQEIAQAFAPHRGKFIRLNNVKVYEKQNQKYCLAASAELANDLPRINVEFDEVRSQYLSRAYDGAIRVERGNLGSYTHLKPVGGRSASDDFDCAQFQWATAEAAKAFAEEFQQNRLYSLHTASVEFRGVRPFGKVGVCEFDTLRVASNEVEPPTATAGARPVQSNTVGQSRFTVTLKGDAVYVNGLTLGMPEDAVKEELRTLEYETENIVSGKINLYDGANSLKVSLRQNKLADLSTNEQDITDRSRDEILDSLKASFGDRISCQESRNARMELISCNYTHKASGDWTSLTVSFRRMGTQKNSSFFITLK